MNVPDAVEAHAEAILDLLDYADGTGVPSAYVAVTAHWESTSGGEHSLNWSRTHGAYRDDDDPDAATTTETGGDDD